MSNNIKGLQCSKSMQNVAKSGIPNKEESDFIKLYMYEKERTRLNTEKIKILLRLEVIEDRLTEIQAYNNEKAKHMHIPQQPESSQNTSKTEFKTMSIDY